MDGVTAPSSSHSQVTQFPWSSVTRATACSDTLSPRSLLFPQRGAAAPGGVERVRREAQLAALRYDEERQKNRPFLRDSGPTHSKVRPLCPASQRQIRPTACTSEDLIQEVRL